MTAEELYKKEFGNADSIPKESVLRLLKNFARALNLEREKALRIHDVVGQSEQLKAFAVWVQKRMWEGGDKDFDELVDEFLSL